MERTCADCDRELPRTSYTTNQWSRGRGISRCAGCVHGHHSDRPQDARGGSGRHNLSTSGTPSGDEPFAEGTFRWVGKGTYTSGPRSGQPCVHKWFKSGSVFSDDFFTLDIKAVDKALEFIDKFNELGIVAKTIKLNIPAVWHYSSGSREGEKILVEPFIRNYQKFNSNSGWTNDDDGWAEVMQALSHFSYHVSGGFYVLCDIQGGIYAREVVLSDPVILSRTRQFGVTDLGPPGISSFFNEHCCNNYCRPHWSRPAKTAQHFRPVSGTSMIRRDVPTGAGGAPSAFIGSFTLITEEDEDGY
ncbi:elongation factor 2 [Cordyceps militaris]|uniref:Elongation factor 2 n=1 Tax=Cordyceps militaris TaxID=73501 RepID=A0A2H4SGG4_CORMI|nr:elongation factor 2 [Cordyceps militaris]